MIESCSIDQTGVEARKQTAKSSRAWADQFQLTGSSDLLSFLQELIPFSCLRSNSMTANKQLITFLV